MNVQGTTHGAFLTGQAAAGRILKALEMATTTQA